MWKTNRLERKTEDKVKLQRNVLLIEIKLLIDARYKPRHHIPLFSGDQEPWFFTTLNQILFWYTSWNSQLIQNTSIYAFLITHTYLKILITTNYKKGSLINRCWERRLPQHETFFFRESSLHFSISCILFISWILNIIGMTEE